MREARWAPASADDEFLADVERHVARVQQDATRVIARCRGATSRTRRICALATFIVWSLAFVGLSAPEALEMIRREVLRHALHHGRIKDWFDHTLELDENLAPISATVTVTKKVLGCFDEPRVAFQLSYTQGTQGMPRVERLES